MGTYPDRSPEECRKRPHHIDASSGPLSRSRPTLQDVVYNFLSIDFYIYFHMLKLPAGSGLSYDLLYWCIEGVLWQSCRCVICMNICPYGASYYLT